jgi:hypothetical protein
MVLWFHGSSTPNIVDFIQGIVHWHVIMVVEVLLVSSLIVLYGF